MDSDLHTSFIFQFHFIFHNCNLIIKIKLSLLKKKKKKKKIKILTNSKQKLNKKKRNFKITVHKDTYQITTPLKRKQGSYISHKIISLNPNKEKVPN